LFLAATGNIITDLICVPGGSLPGQVRKHCPRSNDRVKQLLGCACLLGLAVILSRLLQSGSQRPKSAIVTLSC